jgi:hypothetical protein
MQLMAPSFDPSMTINAAAFHRATQRLNAIGLAMLHLWLLRGTDGRDKSKTTPALAEFEQKSSDTLYSFCKSARVLVQPGGRIRGRYWTGEEMLLFPTHMTILESMDRIAATLKRRRAANAAPNPTVPE